MNIKELRQKKGITQTEMARQLGVKQPTVAMWETGKSLPRAEMLPKIAKLLECKIDEIIA